MWFYPAKKTRPLLQMQRTLNSRQCSASEKIGVVCPRACTRRSDCIARLSLMHMLTQLFSTFAQGNEINAQSRPVVSSKNENFGGEVCVRQRQFDGAAPGGAWRAQRRDIRLRYRYVFYTVRRETVPTPTPARVQWSGCSCLRAGGSDRSDFGCITRHLRRPTKLLTLRPGPRQACHDTLVDHRSLNSAKTPIIWNIASPDGVVVSIPC